MTKIMANCSHQKTQSIKFVQMQSCLKLTLCEHVVCHLHYVGSVQIIVILHILSVNGHNSIEEQSAFIFIYKLLETHLIHSREHHNWQKLFSSNCFTQFEDIKFDFANIVEMFGVLLDKVKKKIDSCLSSSTFISLFFIFCLVWIFFIFTKRSLICTTTSFVFQMA